MKRARLIRRERSRSDRRMVRTLITERGLDLLAKADQAIRRSHCERLAGLERPSLQALVNTLAEVRQPGA
jgi:DNA-binding MarR family transcriptional regulator